MLLLAGLSLVYIFQSSLCGGKGVISLHESLTKTSRKPVQPNPFLILSLTHTHTHTHARTHARRMSVLISFFLLVVVKAAYVRLLSARLFSVVWGSFWLWICPGSFSFPRRRQGCLGLGVKTTANLPPHPHPHTQGNKQKTQQHQQQQQKWCLRSRLPRSPCCGWFIVFSLTFCRPHAVVKGYVTTIRFLSVTTAV